MKTKISGTKSYKQQCNKIAKEIVYDKNGIHKLFFPQLQTALIFANFEIQGYPIKAEDEEQAFKDCYKQLNVPAEIPFWKFKDITIACYNLYIQEYKKFCTGEPVKNVHPSVWHCIKTLVSRGFIRSEF